MEKGYQCSNCYQAYCRHCKQRAINFTKVVDCLNALFYKKISFLFFLSLITISKNIFAQQIKTPDDILTEKGPLPKLLLVGTSHFAYPNHDAYKIDKTRQIDILSDQKQQELEQLLNYLAQFKPTKIAIEATPKWNAMVKYRQYKKDKKQQPDERYQIAFKLMERLNLDTVYAIDASSSRGLFSQFSTPIFLLLSLYRKLKCPHLLYKYRELFFYS
jgi:hypothetical protein